jgi:hypothetical protein
MPAPAPRTRPTCPALQRETLEEGGVEGEAPRVSVAGRPGRSLRRGRLLLLLRRRRRGGVRDGRGVVGEGGEVEVGEGEVAVGVEEEVRVGEAQERLRVGPPMMPPASAARGRGRQRESRVHVGRRRRLRSSLTAAVLGGGGGELGVDLRPGPLAPGRGKHCTDPSNPGETLYRSIQPVYS